ncbi:MAG: FAD:protein FMN transferase [Nibricoccus sp.]
MELTAQISANSRASGRTSSAVSEELRVLGWNALGTRCEVQYVCGDEHAAHIFESEAVSWVAAFEAKYSRFRSDSLVSRINAAAGLDWLPVDAEMEMFLDLSGSLYQLTQGVLDVTALPLMRLWDYRVAIPRIPSENEILAAKRLVGFQKIQRRPGLVRLPEVGMALDFGGWGKEYAVDIVAQIARKHGIERALIDFGHDIFALGAVPGKPAWHIGLEDPARPGAACWSSVAARDIGVASSGDYIRGFTLNGKRYGHIVDPRTGWPVANGCRQVNVIAKACVQAGALSTAVFILGPEAGLKIVQDLMTAEACVVTDQERYQTRGFYRYVVTK